jgi:hypothetical protein
MQTLRLNPSYADAHFNLALLFEGPATCCAPFVIGSPLKMDNTGTWANIARRQLEEVATIDVVLPSR